MHYSFPVSQSLHDGRELCCSINFCFFRFTSQSQFALHFSYARNAVTICRCLYARTSNRTRIKDDQCLAAPTTRRATFSLRSGHKRRPRRTLLMSRRLIHGKGLVNFRSLTIHLSEHSSIIQQQNTKEHHFLLSYLCEHVREASTLVFRSALKSRMTHCP